MERQRETEVGRVWYEERVNPREREQEIERERERESEREVESIWWYI